MTSTGRGSDFEVRQADWVPVDDARARILESARTLPAESVPIDQAVGRALAEEIVATATLPPWDNSAMDGYAVRASDIEGATAEAPVQLPVEGVVRAGTDAGQSLPASAAIRIMTGAPVPEGADSVVRVEHTDAEQEPGQVRIFSDLDAGRHVRAAGQDMRTGTRLFEAGQAITTGVIGVLAAAGRAAVQAHTTASVALLPTGDELRRVDRYDEVERGVGIPESNGTMLAAMIRDVGARPIDLGVASDDRADIADRIAAGSDADVLVTIGGASMGEADLVKRVLDDVGYERDFWRVKMRPGSPISFGWLQRGDRRQAVFGLPGNPSSAFVTFEVFVRPYLLRLAGHRRVVRRTVTCVADERIVAPASLTYFQRVTVERIGGVLRARLTGPQISGLVRGLAQADGLAIVAADRPSVEIGEQLPVMLLDTGPGAVEFALG